MVLVYERCHAILVLRLKPASEVQVEGFPIRPLSLKKRVSVQIIRVARRRATYCLLSTTPKGIISIAGGRASTSSMAYSDLPDCFQSTSVLSLGATNS